MNRSFVVVAGATFIAPRPVIEHANQRSRQDQCSRQPKAAASGGCAGQRQ